MGKKKIRKKIAEQMKDLINNQIRDEEVGSLNYIWEFRKFLDDNYKLIDQEEISKIKDSTIDQILGYIEKLDHDNPEAVFNYITAIASYSYIYIRQYFFLGKVDRSLKAVLNICFNSSMIRELEYSDAELDVLTSIFNQTVKSGRENLHCYDCGTVEKGILYCLIKEYRHIFNLTAGEIFRMRAEYLHPNYKDGLSSLSWLMTNLRTISQPCIFIAGLQFGRDKFGHIFVIEKRWHNKQVLIRFFQSALNSYLLMDYLVLMGYFENPLNGIDIDDFERDMSYLMTVKSWGPLEDKIFVKWFAFYPQSEIDDTSHFRINSSYIILS